MPIPNSIGNAFRLLRTGFGETVTISGKSYPAVFGAPSVSDVQSLPDGAMNDADSDVLVCNIDAPASPADWPPVRSTLTRAVSGDVMTVLAVRPDVIGGVAVALRLVCYRRPRGDAGSTGDAQRALLPTQPT